VTERTPSAASWRSWVEHQIEQGREQGAFDDLDGHGRPIGGLDHPHDDPWWLKAKLRREEAVVTPPSRAIRVERDAVLASLDAGESEHEVHVSIEALNDKIRALNRTVTWGPPTSVAPLDVDDVIERWRAGRPATAPEDETSADAPASTTEPRGLLRWRRRRGNGAQTT